MKHKKRGKRRYHKKRVNMKSPLTVTLIILVLFIILIIFSVLKGPIEKKVVEDELKNVIEPQEKIEEIKKGITESPTIRVNKAIKSKDITLCNGDSKCEVSYIFATAKNPEDCDELKDKDMANRCKERL